MTTLDRYVLRSLVVNYLISLTIMISLYMVLDLFFNIDEFTESSDPAWMVLTNIASYYSAHFFLYFSQLSGVITLFACLSALARMRRANELTAILASGVSLYRLAVPVVAFGLATSLLWYLDTEVAIPRVANHLARTHEDAGGRRARGVWFVKDTGGRLLSALEFVPAESQMRQFLVLQRDDRGAAVRVIEADGARWEAIPGHPAGGVWRLDRGVERRRVVQAAGLGPRESIESKEVAVYESSHDPAALEVRQSRQWLKYSSSARLSQLGRSDATLLNRIRQIQHQRFATPLVHVLMLLLGLPFFLSREPANVVTDAGWCLLVCGACFLLAFSAENFVVVATLSALPAWLPIIVFSPLAVVLIDRMRT